MDLHGAGYVHRDLKPGNIMWLPSQNRWTLIDFGCAARIGSEARMGFSVMYAAPEVVRGHYREGQSMVTATTALDAWSIGILAVEMFSGRPALQLFDGREKVRVLACTAQDSVLVCMIVSFCVLVPVNVLFAGSWVGGGGRAPWMLC